MKKIILINLLFCFCISAGQYKTIENQAVRVIFEKGMENQVKLVANNIEKLKTIYEGENKVSLKQIPLVLRKNNVQSNAYFHPLFQKMEFITTPILDNSLGITPWLETLSIHEYRHYNQYRVATNNFNSKFFYLIGGENYRALLDVMTIPKWFKEGDAIYYETKLSNSGRGRTPDFLKKYIAVLEEEKNYTYEKAKNGSYKDNVPNHYYLGYVLVSYGYEKYGDKFWEEILNLTTAPKRNKEAKRFQHPLSNALRVKTGLNSKEFYEEALKYYEEKFKIEKKIEYETINKKAEVPTDYINPKETKDGIVVLKNSFNESRALYKIRGSEEEKIINLGNIVYNYYFSRNNLIVWSEIEPHLTNSKKSYSNIKVYNMETKKRENLTKESYYFYPSISRNQEFIATIKNNGIETTKIHILDNKGKFIKELSNTSDYQYSSIDWSEDDKELIVGLRDKEGKMGIISVDLLSQEERILMPFNNYIIGTINVYENNVYFTGAFDFISNEYRLDINSGKVYKLTSSNIGTSGGRVINGELYFSEYSANGYNLKKNIDIEGEEIIPKSLLEIEELNTQDLKKIDLDLMTNTNNKEYIIEDYNYFRKLINIHSWSVGGLGAETSVNLMSTNEVEDFNALVTYINNDETSNNKLYINGTWTRYWPNIELQYGKEWGTKDENEKIGLGLSFPMNFSKNEYLRVSNLKLNCIDYLNKNESQYSLNFDIINSKYPAKKDIVTAGSQKTKFSYITDLDNSKLNTNLALTTKGLSENDGFKYEVTYETDKGQLKHIKDEIISRGYSEKTYDEAIKNSIDYYTPLYYPDFGKAGFYFNRIKTNIFYDNTKLDNKDTYSSIGNKLSLEGKILDLINFETSIQYSYLLEDEDYKIDWGFQLNF